MYVVTFLPLAANHPLTKYSFAFLSSVTKSPPSDWQVLFAPLPGISRAAHLHTCIIYTRCPTALTYAVGSCKTVPSSLVATSNCLTIPEEKTTLGIQNYLKSLSFWGPQLTNIQQKKYTKLLLLPSKCTHLWCYDKIFYMLG